jgi:hypothetical protein
MTTNPNVKAARSAITKIKALTAKIVSSSEYWTTSAGRSLHYYVQEQGEQGLKRKRGRLRGQLRKLDALSYDLGADTRMAIRSLCDCTETVLSYCDHFPRNCEWPGLPLHSWQKRLIADLRQRLKGRAA